MMSVTLVWTGHRPLVFFHLCVLFIRNGGSTCTWTDWPDKQGDRSQATVHSGVFTLDNCKNRCGDGCVAAEQVADTCYVYSTSQTLTDRSGPTYSQKNCLTTTAATTTSSTTTTTTATATTTTTTTPTTTAATTTSPSGLSGGEIAGIVLGTLGAAAAVVGIAAYVWYKLSTKKQGKGNKEGTGNSHGDNATELPLTPSDQNPAKE